MTETLPPVTDVEPERDEARARRRGLLWLVFGGAVVVLVGAGAWLWVNNASTEPAPASAGPVATAQVTRGTLIATETWDGTLGHGSPFTVIVQGGRSSPEGETSESISASTTITRLLVQGATVGRGDELYRVNEQPVILLLGTIPMYRDLGPGATGPDVRQLEANLAKLGYGGFTVDSTYTSSTAAAVRDWQTDIGAQVTGVVPLGSVVFLPERGRVDTLRVDIGDPVSPGTEVLDITGTEQVASLEVDVDDRDVVEVGTRVTVTLPDDSQVAGKVTSVSVVQPEPQPGATEGAAPVSEDVITEVEVTLTEAPPEDFIGAPVEVVVGVEKRRDVLSVPVSALLALAEGGFGLEVVGDGGGTRIVPVETGLFAEGRVEVRGPRITEGTIVGVAGR